MEKDKRNTLIALFIIVVGVIVILFVENGTRVLIDKKYDKLDGIVIDSDLADIDVEYIHALDVNILVYGRKNDDINYYVEDDVLYINKKSSRGFCLFNCKDRIILYLPESFKMLNVKTEIGKVNAEQVAFDKAIISSNIGDIKLGETKEVQITSNIGNVSIKKIDAVSDSNIVTESGDVTVNNTNNLNIDAETYTGKKDIKKMKDNDYVLKIKTNTGDIKVG